MKTILPALLLALLSFAHAAPAMDKLDRPVVVTVPFPAGSAIDVRARIVMKYVKALLGQNVTVENKPGAAGLVGVTGFVTQKTRNHPVLFCGSAVFTAVPLFNKAVYDADSVIPLVSVDAEQFGVFACPDKTGIKSIGDLKSYGERIKYATGAPGSLGHIACASAVKLLGLEADHIVTNGASISLTECLGGHNTVAFAGLGLAKGFVKEGRLVPLFAFNHDTYTGYEGMEIPSLKDLGVDFSYENLTFFSMPRGTNPDVAACIGNAIEKAMRDPACLEELKAAGAENVIVLTGDEITAALKTELEVIRRNGAAIGLSPLR